MELLRLKRAVCANSSRKDLSYTIPNAVAVITTTYPRDIVWMGRVLPPDVKSSTQVYTPSVTWWQLGYSPSTRMVYARPVQGNSKVKVLSDEIRLGSVDGAYITFSVDSWDARVSTKFRFRELAVEQISEEAKIAALMSIPPHRLCIELGYSLFKPESQHEIILPYVTEWVGIHIPQGVATVFIPDGVRHVSVYSSDSEPAIYLPDSVVSCFIDPHATLRMSISKSLAKVWGYWSAVWGKPYIIKQNFVCTPDGLVTVRPVR